LWAIDYPEAEEHFLPALRRITNLSVADDSIHLEITDDRIFDPPAVAGNLRRSQTTDGCYQFQYAYG
jgi:hypothetical protein